VNTQTVYEVAEEFRCSPRKISDVARANRIGANLGGRAGWRFTEADKAALWDAMRPAQPASTLRRRRRVS
jgi:hypothetical protein